MLEETDSTPAPAPPPKAISKSRDRLQSNVLVCLGMPALACLSCLACRYCLLAGHNGRVYLALALAISLLFALAAWRLRAATALAAACGGMICLCITVLSGRPDGPSPFHSGLAPLILLFVLTREATKMGRGRKPASDQTEEKHGRNAAQVLANLGVAALASSCYYLVFRHPPQTWRPPYVLAAIEVPMLAALAEATADTVSSEIGHAFGGTPRMLLTLRRVAPGTDGAITLLGTLAGIAAAALVAITGMPALGMEFSGCMHSLAAGIAGLFFDSLLGATLERKGWIGNDVVNLASTLFAAMVALFTVPGNVG
jgi:uncharacterized protein (TIGR00297 family)